MKKHYFFSLLMTAGAHVALAQSPDLEAYISFNGSTTAINAGNVLAVSTAGINSGAMLTTDRNGNPNSAVNLNGSAFIDFGDHPNFRFGMDDFTVALWMRGDATQVGQGIPIGKRGFIDGQDYAYMFGWTASTQQVLAYYRDDNGSAGNWPTVSVPSGQWQHLAMVFDRGAGMMYVYVNGTQVSFANISDLMGFDATGTSAGQLMVGRSSQGGQFFKGDIDEVYVIRRALTESQIASLIDPSLCIVNIPDANFKAALVGNNSINTNQDGEIQCDEASSYTGSLDLANTSIINLTGLEAFTSATTLNLSGNNLSSVDLTANSALTQVILSSNPIFTVQLPPSTSVFACTNCALTSLDVSGLPSLTVLGFTGNDITGINLSNNPLLMELSCSDNQLAALNTSSNPLLEYVSAFNNQITSLDFSTNPVLNHIDISDNQLTSLNIANGNNQNFTFYDFFGNPNLTCIQVDNAAWSMANMSVPPGAIYSENCLTVGIEESQIVRPTVFPNPTSGILNLTQPSSGQVLDISGRSLMTFGNARSLDLSNLASGSYVVRTADGGVMRVVRE
jgi:hypothetical protein